MGFDKAVVFDLQQGGPIDAFLIGQTMSLRRPWSMLRALGMASTQRKV